MWRHFLRSPFLPPLSAATFLSACHGAPYLRSFDCHDASTRQFLLRRSTATAIYCAPKADELRCTSCKELLARASFARRQQHRTTRICSDCAARNCAPKAETLQCTSCNELLPRETFADRQHHRSTRICRNCAVANSTPTPKDDMLQCTSCSELLPREAFADRQHHRSTRICGDCVARKHCRAPASSDQRVRFFICNGCGESQTEENFSNTSRHDRSYMCKTCSTNGRPPQPLARIDLGTLTQQCSHCTARLFPSEGTTFCCGKGKHFVDFTAYHQPPDAEFLKLFACNWPYLDAKGNPVHDARTNAPRLTGFSAMSRRYNNLFAFAMHEIQSTTSERELHFGNELRPSNVRIHGTMYRRIWTCADSTPLRYLVIDPKERDTQARLQHVDMKVFKKLEKLLLSRNGYAQVLQRLNVTTSRVPTVAVELQWDEGINELAAVVHTSPEIDVSSRSVIFRRHGSQRPQYLNPLSALYEPLSYPLWFPYGGRGWSTDVRSRSGAPISQMWWYRQLLLRMSYMHLCGRLLNEWLVNMYCRMEDERLSNLRREQTKHRATRSEMCEALANEEPVRGTSTFLPSSVPGSPRHLRRLRIDSLELARRKGPPTFGNR